MTHVHSAGGVVIGPDGRIALVRQPDYAVRWSLPKGRQHPGEPLEDTARRKIIAETGLVRFEFVREFPPYSRGSVNLPDEPDTNETKMLHFFLAHTIETELRPISPSIGEALRVTAEEAVELLTHPADREFLQTADLNLD